MKQLTLKTLITAAALAMASTVMAAEEGGGDRGSNNMNPTANDSASYNTRMSNGREIRRSADNPEAGAYASNRYDDGYYARNGYYDRDGNWHNGYDNRTNSNRANNRAELRNSNPTAGGGGIPASAEQKNSATKP